MKKHSLLLLFTSFVWLVTFSQNIGIGTQTPKGKLHIKGSADTAQLVIDAHSGQTTAQPLIRLRNALGKDLMHISSDDTTNTFLGLNAGSNNERHLLQFNTFIGSQAGFSNTKGWSNTALGYSALYSNLKGGRNTAIGATALYSNISGDANVAVGHGALKNNLEGTNNVAVGLDALSSNTAGFGNIATGVGALQFNESGSYNSAHGYQALSFSREASYNTAQGYHSLFENISGTNNTAVGTYALYLNKTGNNNTAVGYLAGTNSNSYSNTTAIGAQASINANNKIRLGNTNVTVIEGQVAFSHPSDARFKYDIRNNVPGLDFVLKLNPVTYYFDEESLAFYNKTGVINNNIARPVSYNISDQLHTGFLAQDVEKAAKELGYSFDGIHTPANDRDHYSLAYSQFIMPLVKAVQEQQSMISQLQEIVKKQQLQIQELIKEKK